MAHEKTETFKIDGGAYNVPMVDYGGGMMSPEEAIREYFETLKRYGGQPHKYQSTGDAVNAAKMRSFLSGMGRGQSPNSERNNFLRSILGGKNMWDLERYGMGLF